MGNEQSGQVEEMNAGYNSKPHRSNTEIIRSRN